MSERRKEGVLMIDHRAGPGLDASWLKRLGLIGLVSDNALGAGKVFEAPTYTCAHCHATVVMEPRRTRERAKCHKCNERICDDCGAIAQATGGECKNLKQMIAEVQEQLARGHDLPILIVKE